LHCLYTEKILALFVFLASKYGKFSIRVFENSHKYPARQFPYSLKKLTQNENKKKLSFTEASLIEGGNNPHPLEQRDFFFSL